MEGCGKKGDEGDGWVVLYWSGGLLKMMVCGWAGLEIASNGIQIMEDNFGRPSGEAYVELASKEQTEKARARDRECIGPRC